MTSKKPSTVHKGQKHAPIDSKNSKVGSENTSGNNSGAGKKTKSAGTIVKSRYLQPVDKKPLAKSTIPNESTFVAPRPASPKVGSSHKPRVGTPPRRSMAPQSALNPTSMMSSILEPLSFGGNILQSTVLDGHCLCPDFDVSAIKEKTVSQNTVEPAENEKKILEMQSLFLAYLTAKMEHNTHRLREEAERSILTVMEEEDQMQAKVNEKKRQHLLLEKHKQLNSLLDLQITALTPVAAAAKQFTQEYKSFATAVDTTRHELPVKNFYIEEDRGEFLDKACVCLKESEGVLQQYTQGIHQGNDKSSECLKDIKSTALEINDQLSGGFSEVLELSSLVHRQTVQIQQAREEEELGLAAAQNLYCPSL